MNNNDFPRRHFWQNIETGELLTRREMMHQAETVYLFDEFTPFLEIFDYYEKTDHEIPERSFRDTESGEIITESALYAEFCEKSDNEKREHNYSFFRYLAECTGKNGTLTEI